MWFLSFLFGFLSSPIFWIIAVSVAVLVAVLWFTGQQKLLLTIALDARVWLAIAAVLLFLSVDHVQKQNVALQQQIVNLQNQKTADTDAQKTDQTRQTQQTQRQVQHTQHQAIITQAQPGQAEDDLLDQFAKDRPDLNGGSSNSADGVRKHPDGVVVP